MGPSVRESGKNTKHWQLTATVIAIQAVLVIVLPLIALELFSRPAWIAAKTAAALTAVVIQLVVAQSAKKTVIVLMLVMEIPDSMTVPVILRAVRAAAVTARKTAIQNTLGTASIAARAPPVQVL